MIKVTNYKPGMNLADAVAAVHAAWPDDSNGSRCRIGVAIDGGLILDPDADGPTRYEVGFTLACNGVAEPGHFNE